MATTTSTEARGPFKIMNQAAVDFASLAAVTSVDVDIDVEMADGQDQYPLKAGDLIVGPFAAAAGAGWAAIEAKFVVVGNVYKDDNTLTLRATNAGASAVDPASIAANAMYWLVFRF